MFRFEAIGLIKIGKNPLGSLLDRFGKWRRIALFREIISKTPSNHTILALKGFKKIKQNHVGCAPENLSPPSTNHRSGVDCRKDQLQFDTSRLFLQSGTMFERFAVDFQDRVAGSDKVRNARFHFCDHLEIREFFAKILGFWYQFAANRLDFDSTKLLRVQRDYPGLVGRSEEFVHIGGITSRCRAIFCGGVQLFLCEF